MSHCPQCFRGDLLPWPTFGGHIPGCHAQLVDTGHQACLIIFRGLGIMFISLDNRHDEIVIGKKVRETGTLYSTSIAGWGDSLTSNRSHSTTTSPS